MAHLRDSMYPTPSYDFLTPLDDCAATTSSCVQVLGSGMEKLGRGTRDLPRLSKVLKNEHHYLVLPQPVISNHLANLSTTLAPQIDQLISKAEALLDTQSTRVAHLEERLSIIQSAKLPPVPVPTRGYAASEEGQSFSSTLDGDGGEGKSRLDGIEMKDLNPVQRRKVMTLKAKRQRLEEEKIRLEEAGA